MATKAKNEFSSTAGVRGLDTALKHSFTNIKNDMTVLKEGMHQQGVKLAEMKQDMKDTKSDFVTLDKFNIVKIKIGELNENMKKVWDLEKKLEDLDRKSVSSTEFDQLTAELNNEIKKIKEDLSDLNEVATTEEQTRHLIDDINGEFDGVKQSIDELRSIKDAITKEELDKRSDTLDKKAKEVRKDFEKVKAEIKSKISTAQVEALVSDINNEFDSIKKLITRMKEGEAKFARANDVEKQFAKKDKQLKDLSENITSAIDEFSKGVEMTFKEFTKANDKDHGKLSRETEKAVEKLATKLQASKAALSQQHSELRDEVKKLVTKKQVENLIKDLNKEFDSVKGDAEQTEKALNELRKEAATRKELAAEIARLKKGMESLSSDLTSLRKVSSTKEETSGFFEDLSRRISDLNKELKSKFNDLVKRIKKESDATGMNIKQNSQDIDLVEKTLRKDLKPLVKKDDLHAELDVVTAEFEKLYKELKQIQESMAVTGDIDDINKTLKQHIKSTKAEFVNMKRFDKLVSTVERLQDQVDVQSDLLAAKQKEIRAYAKEMKAAKRAERKLAKYESVVAKKADRAFKADKPKVPYRKSGFLGNFLVGAAFVILLVAIGLFFAGVSGLTDSLAIAAVICFVLGIVIRVVVSFKRNGKGKKKA